MTLLFFSFFLFDHVTLQNATGKLFMSPVKKMERQTLFRGTIVVGVGTPTVEFCSRGERLSLTPNSTRRCGNL